MKLILVLLLTASFTWSADGISAGTSFNGTTATPFASYDKDLGSGVRSITSVQVTKITLKPGINFQTVTTQDFGYDFTTLLPASIQKHASLIALGGGGASASATALTGAFDGGGLGVIHTPKFDIVMGARIIRTAQSGTQTVPILALRFVLK